jgi:hypothetical protein
MRAEEGMTAGLGEVKLKSNAGLPFPAERSKPAPSFGRALDFIVHSVIPLEV